MKEDYVSFEIAKLLKEKGFREWSLKCYGVAVLHNGVAISFDEECELKDEGRENEIEYVEGGVLYDCGCNNSDKDAKVWAAPTLQMAMKWLREVKAIHICVKPNEASAKCKYFVTVIASETKWGNIQDDNRKTIMFDTYESACESAIKYCLEHLI